MVKNQTQQRQKEQKEVVEKTCSCNKIINTGVLKTCLFFGALYALVIKIF
jgi:hypothetical protein